MARGQSASKHDFVKRQGPAAETERRAGGGDTGKRTTPVTGCCGNGWEATAVLPTPAHLSAIWRVPSVRHVANRERVRGREVFHV